MSNLHQRATEAALADIRGLGDELLSHRIKAMLPRAAPESAPEAPEVEGEPEAAPDEDLEQLLSAYSGE